MKIKDLLTAFGQVALIFIGVTVAIWFENINDERKDQQFEKILLKEMILNLEKDVQLVGFEAKIIKRGQMSSKKIYNIITTEGANSDSLRFFMVHMMYYSTQVFNTSAYETIKSRGLDLIKDNDLRQSITNYYEVELKLAKEQEKISYNLGWGPYMNIALGKFKDFSLKNGMWPINLEALKKDNEFKQFVAISGELKKFEVFQYNSVIKSAQNLIVEIKKAVD